MCLMYTINILHYMKQLAMQDWWYIYVLLDPTVLIFAALAFAAVLLLMRKTTPQGEHTQHLASRREIFFFIYSLAAQS